MKTHLLLLLSSLLPGVIGAQTFGRPAILKDVGIDQKMGAQVPLDLPFMDESGQAVTLRQYAGKPIILALVYYQCPSLCSLILNGIEQAAKQLEFTAGQEYQIVAISFDPRENYPIARDKRESYVRDYGRSDSSDGWHFLTAQDASSRGIADAVGFHYKFDPLTNQYIHPSAIMLLTPEGHVSRYFYGVNYSARDLKLGMMDAAGRKIGSPLDQAQLFCFHYDPNTGKYGFAIMAALRAAGIFTLGGLAIFIVAALLREREAVK